MKIYLKLHEIFIQYITLQKNIYHMFLIYFSPITNQILNHQKCNSFMFYKNSLTPFFVFLSSTDIYTIHTYINIIYTYFPQAYFQFAKNMQHKLPYITPSFAEGQTARQF